MWIILSGVKRGKKTHISWSVELITEKKKNRSRYIFKVWQ